MLIEKSFDLRTDGLFSNAVFSIKDCSFIVTSPSGSAAMQGLSVQTKRSGFKAEIWPHLANFTTLFFRLRRLGLHNEFMRPSKAQVHK